MGLEIPPEGGSLLTNDNHVEMKEKIPAALLLEPAWGSLGDGPLRPNCGWRGCQFDSIVANPRYCFFRTIMAVSMGRTSE